MNKITPFLSLKRILSFTLLLVIYSAPTYGVTIKLVESTNNNSDYAIGLLKLALSKSSTPYQFEETIEPTTTARLVEMLNKGTLDVFWVVTNREWEEKMLPIRVPLYRGLLGYRVLMIRKGNQGKFDGIQTISDLNRISIGQGRSWADTDILESNGINVVKATKYDSLFHMLDGKRFDAFPRGIQEPWAEIQSRPDLALEVEKNLLIAYTSPYYLFVQKNNIELAREIESGLMTAIEDGSFEEYFFNYPTIKDILKKANLNSRTVIHLNNPLLPEATPLDKKELWLDPYSI